MAWQDQIKPAAYTSAESKTRTVFDYENVRVNVEKKTTAFNFPDANGTYIQDLGHTGRRYPFRLFFWGDDYHIVAEAFLESLLERGAGTLEHPLYGTKTVIPFGAISRRDDLKTAANQAVFDVTFWETTDVIFPSIQDDAGAAVLSALEIYAAASASEFDSSITTDTVSQLTKFKNGYTAILDVAEDGLQGVADVQESVAKQFNAISDSINRGIDVLVSQPLTLGFQTGILLQTPARSLAQIKARLSAYKDLAASIIGGTESTLTAIDEGGGVTSPSLAAEASNEFHTANLFASTAVAGSVLSAVDTQFLNKTAALEAAEDILEQMDTATVWKDDAYRTLDQIDQGEAYQPLQDAVALVAGFLIDISFSLKQERRIVLDRDRNIVELAAELYGAIDDELDFLITSNNLSGSEIINLPRGREIVYYV